MRFMPSLHPINHMHIVETLNAQQIVQLHQLFQQEWWSESRTLEDTRRCVEGSQLCIGLIDPQETLVGFARVLTDATFKAP